TLAAIFFLIGTLVFSGSLYTLSLSGIRWWGAITPIGGVLLILGWTTLFYGGLREWKTASSQSNQS
ncbi:MAG: DUF423 domain-containing protein, partial [Candidatus Omnitrophica bacterium]|nr:DUF423 domain-containing protein [Candidatus Omnitrophota bacterium]